MKKVIIALITCATLTSCGELYSYHAIVIMENIGTGAWIDCNKREYFESRFIYKVGDTLYGACDVKVIVATNNSSNKTYK